ncbi:MAG: potassium channel family protein [Terriglobia bacterium]
MRARRRIVQALSLIGVVLLLGATGFHYIEGWPWFDGLYMTLITITTVGYGETHPLSQSGKVFNAFLLLAAVVAGGLLIASFSHAMLEFEFSNFLGRRRMERDLAKLENHYIICGAGRVGRTVAHELRAQGSPCVIIEKESSRAEWAAEEGIPVLIGSGHTDDTLERARIQHARGLVAAVTSDADNLYIVLTARGMKPDLKIIARAGEEEATPKLLRAGATEVVSPYHFVGRRIANLLLHPHVLDFLEAAFGHKRLDMLLEEVRVSDASSLAGKSLTEATIQQQTGALLLGVKRADGAITFNPAPSTIIHPGDYLIAMGASDDLRKLESLAGA